MRVGVSTPVRRMYSSALLDIGNGARCSDGAGRWGARCLTGEPSSQRASAVHLLNFKLGPRASCSFRLTPVIALVARACRFPRACDTYGGPGVPLLLRLAGVCPGRLTLCCGLDSHDCDDEKTSIKEESDHGVSACASLSRCSHGGDTINGSGICSE